MLTANQLKPGTPVMVEGRAYIVDSTSVGGTAQRRRTFHVKMHDVVTGQNFEKSFGETDKFEEPELKKREVQLSYKKGREHIFMDQEDFQEYSLSEEQLAKARYFLREGESYRILILDERPVGLELPSAFTLAVTETAAPTNMAAGSSALKDALLESGLTVKVPPFIKVGERLRISTETLEYLGKA
jgi:elongation factor P